MIRLLLALLLLPAPLEAATPTVRVALVRDAADLRLTGRNFYCFSPTTPDAERTRFPKQASFIHYTGAGFVVDGQFFQVDTLECISGEGILTINTIPTQGHVRLLPDGAQKIAAVVTLPMEQYLIGVLQGEVGENWPPEALKAQAIAARSYTMSIMNQRRGKPYDVVTTTKDQVYTPRIKIPTTIQAAVLDTQGQILKFKGQTLRAFYHSCCGGTGEAFTAVWTDLAPGKTPPPFTPVVAEDHFCKKSPQRRWELTLSEADFLKALRTQAPKITSASQVSYKTDAQGRINDITIATDASPVHLSGNQFRKALGYETLRSTHFKVKQHGPSITFSGRGFGHGVGLCQWGAKGMAEKKKTASQILQFYYPGAELTKPY